MPVRKISFKFDINSEYTDHPGNHAEQGKGEETIGAAVDRIAEP